MIRKLLVLLALAGCATAPPPSASAPLALESSWARAIGSRDEAAIAALLTDDFIGTTPDGEIRRKADEVAAHVNAPNVEGLRRFSFQDAVSVSPAMIVIAGETYHRKAAEERRDPMRFTAVWRLDGAAWKLAAMHLSRTRSETPPRP